MVVAVDVKGGGGAEEQRKIAKEVGEGAAVAAAAQRTHRPTHSFTPSHSR